MENKLISVNDDIIKDISTKLIEYLDFKDSIFENEFVESFGDSFKVVKLLKSGHDLIAQRKLKAFLNGFCYDNTPTEEQLLKLYKYINNEKKAEFIADMFSKVLMSNSKLACMIMGMMINDLTENNKDINHSQLICANALVSFFDDDVKNYYKIIDFMYENMKEKLIEEYKGFYQGHRFYSYCKNNKMDTNSMNMTLYKSISYQLFLTNYEVDVDVDVDEDFYASTDVNPSTYISLTTAGELFFEYINKISSCLE
ncbi:hypothetical protein [uncultured Tissierella sp.]|uniref:hypothetical protein n=1 Tax=uncultured Tissierella sp. TaxID=448160 RepID=UPI0028049621|nr:hypothetical protein [uncultured Tissierella sp.]MDU5081204.1 hypothetical protein [Bacillota bacterium]